MLLRSVKLLQDSKGDCDNDSTGVTSANYNTSGWSIITSRVLGEKLDGRVQNSITGEC